MADRGHCLILNRSPCYRCYASVKDGGNEEWQWKENKEPPVWSFMYPLSLIQSSQLGCPHSWRSPASSHSSLWTLADVSTNSHALNERVSGGKFQDVIWISTWRLKPFSRPLCFGFSEDVPRETLLHFAARLGLLRLTWFLLKQPGGRSAVSVPNSEGATPVSLALERGYQKLHQILNK